MITALTSEVTRPPTYCVGGLMWTVAEKQRLMNTYKRVPMDRLPLLFPDRTLSAIMSRASLLRIPRPGLKWTREEDALLRKVYGKMPWEQLLSLFPGRTYHAVVTRASKVNAGKIMRRWTPEEEELLVELRSLGLSYIEIAERFRGRSPGALWLKTKRLLSRGVTMSRPGTIMVRELERRFER